MGKLTNKVWDAKEGAAAQARAEYIQKVMKWEEVDYETAFCICTGKTDPKEPEYTLGYKMADPVYMLAMFGQVRKSKREQARNNFRQLLDDDEMRLFDEYVNKDDTEKQFKSAYKKEKKSKGVKE